MMMTVSTQWIVSGSKEIRHRRHCANEANETNENTCLLCVSPREINGSNEMFAAYVAERRSGCEVAGLPPAVTPSRVHSSTLECASSMSHSVAVALAWEPSECFSFSRRPIAPLTHTSLQWVWPRLQLAATTTEPGCKQGLLVGCEGLRGRVTR